jgi:hypothetical protein
MCKWASEKGLTGNLRLQQNDTTKASNTQFLARFQNIPPYVKFCSLYISLWFHLHINRFHIYTHQHKWNLVQEKLYLPKRLATASQSC